MEIQKINKKNIANYPWKDFNFYLAGGKKILTKARLNEGIDIGVLIYTCKKGENKFICEVK